MLYQEDIKLQPSLHLILAFFETISKKQTKELQLAMKNQFQMQNQVPKFKVLNVNPSQGYFSF